MTTGLPVHRALNTTPASSTQSPQNAVGEPVAGAGAGAAGAPGTPAGPPGAGATSTVVAGATGPPGPTGMTRGIPNKDAQRPLNASRYHRTFIVLNVDISPLLLTRLPDADRWHLMNLDEVGGPLHPFRRMLRVACDPVQTWTWMLQPMDWGIAQHVALILKGV